MNAAHYILKRSTASNKAKTSRQIWTINADGEEKNTNLRLRFILNNGMNALLGKSKSNKNSSPVLKIQQDNVDKFMTGCDNATYCEYAETTIPQTLTDAATASIIQEIEKTPESEEHTTTTSTKI